MTVRDRIVALHAVLQLFRFDQKRFTELAVHDVGPEAVGDVLDVGALQFLPVDVVDDLEVEVKEVLGAIVLVHSDVFELEVDLDEAVGQKR